MLQTPKNLCQQRAPFGFAQGRLRNTGGNLFRFSSVNPFVPLWFKLLLLPFFPKPCPAGDFRYLPAVTARD